MAACRAAQCARRRHFFGRYRINSMFKLHALSDQEYSLMLAPSASFCDFFAGFSNMQMRSLRYAVVLKRQLLRYRNTCAADCFAK
jgi:hypothetical protein